MKHLRSSFKTLFVLSIMSVPSIFISCTEENDEQPDYPEIANQTVIMYMPWADSGIYGYFLKNISAFETAIEQNHGLGGNSLVVFISENGYTSHMIRISYEDGECRRDTLNEYSFYACDYTTADGISQIIRDAKEFAPANKYALAIGCHGMGWIPSGTNVGTRVTKTNSKGQPVYQTRFFGSASDSRYQTDIATLAEGLAHTGQRMEYVLFDDCYMSNIETAYDLRNVTDYLIASTCEIMIEGMPYDKIGIDLLNNDFKGVVDGFYDFYSSFKMPCGTIGVTDCHEVEEMAYIMQQINVNCPDLSCNVTEIQDLDGFENTIFFDFGDYVNRLCMDQSLLDEFNSQLERLVPYKACTDTYYSSYSGKEHVINTFSGLTISDPSINRSITNVKTQTNWYRDTH